MGAAESTPVVELDQSVAGQSSNAYVNDFFALFLDVKAFPSVVDATIRKLARRSPDVFELKHSRYFVVQDTDPVVPEIAKAILAYYPEVQENLRAVLVPERLSELLFWTRFLFLVKQNTGAGYERERQVAVASVLLACRATTAVYRNLVSDETLTKNDKSPVTIADFASQAIIINELRKVFPDDPIVGEEDAAALRESSAEATALRDKVLKLVNGAYAERAQAAVAARAANADADADDDDDDGDGSDGDADGSDGDDGDGDGSDDDDDGGGDKKAAKKDEKQADKSDGDGDDGDDDKKKKKKKKKQDKSDDDGDDDDGGDGDAKSGDDGSGDKAADGDGAAAPDTPSKRKKKKKSGD